MSGYPMVKVVLESEQRGYIIAGLPHPGEEDLPPSRRAHMGTWLVVGQVQDLSAHDQPRGFPREGPEAWKAWLWPKAGGDLHVSQSCEAVEAGTSAELGEKIRKRAAKGPWWR